MSDSLFIIPGSDTIGESGDAALCRSEIPAIVQAGCGQ
jgi:hypothetical protein